MRERQDISEKVNIDSTDEVVEIILHANQYQLDRIEQYQFFLKSKRNLLRGRIIEATEERLVIHYQKNSQTNSLEQVLKQTEQFQRLLIAQKINGLLDFLNSPVQPFLHPANLFVFGEEIVIAHRGFMKSIVPYSANENDFLKQYRALVLAILHPKLNYERLIEGSGTLKDDLSRLIQSVESVEEINQIIVEQIVRQKEKREAELQIVKKKNYLIFKWGSLLLSISTVGFGIVTGIYAFNKLPAQERINFAKTQYITNDYASVLSTLKEDSPENLPIGAQYIIAVSSVHLANLSNEQKATILKQLSQKSNENLLLYWIYIGKGEFDKSLDIALNLGDNQYILHAYTKLYDATKVNNKMNGEKKQELLTIYEEEINKYMKSLEEKVDEDQKK